MTEHILCSALYYDDGIQRPHQPPNIETGIVVCGLRHCNALVILAELFQDYRYKNHFTQGFLTSGGRYVDREEGAILALEAGQIEKLRFDKTKLFSEDLW